MEKLTEKQEAYKNYLLQRLGFRDNKFLKQYLEKLDSIAFVHRNLRAIVLDRKNWSPDSYNIIDFLSDEAKIKKENKIARRNGLQDSISATDLASYTYCPVSYAIAKSFNIDENEQAEAGAKMHEESRFATLKLTGRIDFTKKRNWQDKEDKLKELSKFITNENKSFFNELLGSDLIFAGHSSKQSKYYQNDEMNFRGQPDYVFRNDKGKIFIVEEKFRKSNSGDTFYRNHKVQLASYIHYLKEVRAEYGYLVYWKYYNANNSYVVEKCHVEKISKSNQAKEYLDSAWNDVRRFNKNQIWDVDVSNLSPQKCAACVHCPYCGHKNGRHNKVTIPYKSSYHDLYPAPFPDILEKR